jgi:UDP-N-acetylmuramoylalanine--D-glutamate ligase
MSPASDILRWQRALVYGLGLSGRAAAKLLLDKGVPVVAVDRHRQDELQLNGLAGAEGFETILGSDPRGLPADVDGVIVSPGVPSDRPLLLEARERGVPVIAEVELAYRFLEGPVVGITGSNGKSTTTALTGRLLETCGYAVEVCGNIGVPLASVVEGDPGRVFVTELSSFQLEGTELFHPRAAAWLNLSADHLDRHADMGSYANAKRALFANQTADDTAVLNAEDPWVSSLQTPARRRFFSSRGPVEDGCYLHGDHVLEVTPGEDAVELFSRADLEIRGLHNLENAMASALLAGAMGAELDCLREAISEFVGLPHRLQRIAEISGVAWYDDSKGTNTEAVQRSLEEFPDHSVHLILGGRNKGADPRELQPMIERKARHLYFIGEAAEEFQGALGTAAPGSVEKTLPAAVAAAARLARPGEAVVLSPGCASFDQYVDFRQRGRHFQTLVAELGADQSG